MERLSYSIKNPEHSGSGSNHIAYKISLHALLIFSHPDYTVGIGITPIQLQTQVADYTAGGESRPAPKISFSVVTIIKPYVVLGNSYFIFFKNRSTTRLYCCGFSSAMP